MHDSDAEKFCGCHALRAVRLPNRGPVHTQQRRTCTRFDRTNFKFCAIAAPPSRTPRLSVSAAVVREGRGCEGGRAKDSGWYGIVESSKEMTLQGGVGSVVRRGGKRNRRFG